MASSNHPIYRHPYQQQQPHQQHQPHQRVQQTSHKRVQQPQVQGQSRPDAASEQLAAQERAEAKRIQREKIRAATPTDKTMPEGVEDLIIGDGVDQYKKLRDMERKLDAVMMRKRLDLMDPIQSSIKKYTTLRIWISNTVENQPWQGRDLDENAFDFNMGVESTYRVKIEGRVLDDEMEEAPGEKDGDDEDEADAMDTDVPKDKAKKSEQMLEKPMKLSHFFKQITIDFDRNKNLQPDGMTQIEWKKPPPGQASRAFDCLEFERKSDENINITINLYRDEQRERCKLSKELSELLDTDELEKSTVIMAIWEYVRNMNLQQDEEKRIFNCDDRMKAVFHVEQIRFPDLPRLLDHHLSPLPPLILHYTIRCDPTYNADPVPTIYTLHLQSPPVPGVPLTGAHNNPAHAISSPPSYAEHTLALLSNTDTLSALKQHDKHTALLIQSIHHSKLKHAFMTGMAKDPVGFTKRWMSSQQRDLEMVLVEGDRLEGDWVADGVPTGAGRAHWAKGKKWSGREVEEAIAVMVRRDGNAKFRNS